MVDCIGAMMPGEYRSVMNKVEQVAASAGRAPAAPVVPTSSAAPGVDADTAGTPRGNGATQQPLDKTPVVAELLTGDELATKLVPPAQNMAGAENSPEEPSNSQNGGSALAGSKRGCPETAADAPDSKPEEQPQPLPTNDTHQSPQDMMEKKRKLLEQLRMVEQQQALLQVKRTSVSPSSAPVRSAGSEAGAATEDGEARSRRERRARQPSIHVRPYPGETGSPGAAAGASGVTAGSFYGSGKPNVPYASSKRFQFCMKLLKDFHKLKDAAPFRAPVSELWPLESIPGYFDVVLKPMDFRTIGEKLYSGEYTRPGSNPPVFDAGRFSFDFRLVFRNAMAYNKPEDKFHVDAKNLLEKFEARLAELPAVDIDGAVASGGGADGLLRSASPTASRQQSRAKKSKSSGGSVPRPRGFADSLTAGANRTGSGSRTHSESYGRTTGNGKVAKRAGVADGVEMSRKSKGSRNSMEEEYAGLSLKEAVKKLAELNRRRLNLVSDHPMTAEALRGSTLYHLPMSVNEKLKLRDNIQRLGDDHLVELLNIVKRRQGSQVVLEDGEVELELDAYSTNTLREMEAFVNSSLHKKKVGARVANAVSAEELDARIRCLGAVVERLRSCDSAARSDSMLRRAENVDPYASDSSASDSSGSDSE
ncbi:Transcription factor GTE10 [Porphyridium purpureum]|uniref:Transcription factor GTE10 n=1 Tax=Porphyridium purpureum TaxID=35688 RepID=A0A5J4Z4X0_PORPP|nr:Transcription factor GTE10 [Porphyridium purpureum]|eukprot:POR0190..scf295_1